MVTITNEAIEAAVMAAGKMGFLVTHTVMAPILEAGFKANFGPDIEIDDELYKIAKLERHVAAMSPVVKQIGDWINANGPALEELLAEPVDYHAREGEPYADY